MYVKKENVKEVNFLASAKFQNFTYQVDDTGVEADANGKKIVQAGTVFKKDGVAVGLVFADVDVTNGPQAAAIMVEGYVLEARLPAEVSAEDKAAMKEIKFR
ncbi:MAG: hypothetical protein HFJ48_06405 [Clostridia bacterium]|nr:hypothetical protein [Clostridia bacterium]MCI9413392.1 hypothetical protein [Clostridia bacterium]